MSSAGASDSSQSDAEVLAPSGIVARTARLARRAASARGREVPRRTRNLLLAVSLAAFVLLAAWGWLNRPEIEGGLQWGYLAAVVPVMAALLVMKAVEYRVAGRFLGLRTSMPSALEVAVLSGAANLLPIPGSVMVTAHSLSVAGTTYGKATSATAAVGVTWLALTGVYGGIAFAVSGAAVLGVAAVGCGLALLTGAWFLARAGGSRSVSTFLFVIVVETGFIGVSALQFWLILRSLGVDPTVEQAVALTMAGSLATAMSFLPSGLGLRELLAGLISPIVDLEASVGVLMSVLSRVIWLGVLALGVVVIWALDPRGARRAADRPVEPVETSS